LSFRWSYRELSQHNAIVREDAGDASSARVMDDWPGDYAAIWCGSTHGAPSEFRFQFFARLAAAPAMPEGWRSEDIQG
jgi:hypothetical protein